MQHPLMATPLSPYWDKQWDWKLALLFSNGCSVDLSAEKEKKMTWIEVLDQRCLKSSSED